MSDPVLTLTGLSKSHGTAAAKIDVLRDVNFSLARGETVALVAPSGAGKSTLLHIAGLLDSGDLGEVRIAGQLATGAADGLRTRIRRQEIGFVYQFHHLLPEFSALENVMLPQLANGTAKGEARSRSEDLLNRAGLGDRLKHRPGTLSGGEQQRVAFCRALANRPSVLLADEPTGNLDPETSDRVFEMLRQLVQESGKMGALIATHNMELARRMDRMLRLEGGKLVEVPKN